MNRLLPAALALTLLAHAQPPGPLNDKVAAFCSAQAGKRVGGGECAQLACEALRASGAKFMRSADAPEAGDYVWGTALGLAEVTDGKLAYKVKGKLRPGDVVQYRDATFKGGARYPHHTSVVADVDDAGRVTAVYEQNVGPTGKADRTVRKTKIDFTRMTGGWVRFYRPEPRAPRPGRWEFTVVNNTAGDVAVVIFTGKMRLFDVKLTKQNTMNSHGQASATATGTLPTPSLDVNGARITVVDGAAFEVYDKDGKTALRRLP